MAKHTKKTEYLTPKGKAVFPALIKYDEYQGKQFYKTGLVVSEEEYNKVLEAVETEVQPYKDEKIADLKKRIGESKGAAKVKLEKALAEMEAAKIQFSGKAELNEETGDQTGNFVINFKQNAFIKITDKKGVEKEVPITIPLFDAKGKEITGSVRENLKLWGGSVIRIRYIIVPAWIESTKVFHGTLRPLGVQVIELSKGGHRSAADMGFGTEEGYEAEDESSFPTEGDSAGNASDASSEDPY